MPRKVFELPLLCLALGLALGLAGCREKIRPRSLADAIVAAAQQHPAHRAEWDATIRDLAARYAHQEQFGGLDAELGRRAKQALDAGCQDPFVRYLWVYHQYVPIGLKPELLLPEAKEVAEELSAHSYPSYVRSGAAETALTVANFMVLGADEPTHKLLADLQWKSAFGGINNPEVPEWEARFLADELSKLWMYSPPAAREDTEAEIDAAVTKRFGKGSLLHFLHGTRHLRRAWRITDRGHTNTAERTEYTRQLTLAKDELELAWRDDPKNAQTACCMIGVCEGLQLPRRQMESWFTRALATGCDGSDACDAKLDYLGTNVLGSLADRVAFGREALAHPEYGWDAGLKLWLAHWRHQTWDQSDASYLAQPDVWQDIKDSIVPYLKRYPEAQHTRLHYAYHAWLAHDWPVFREQFAQVDPDKLDLRLLGGPPVIAAMRADFARNDSLPPAPKRAGEF